MHTLPMENHQSAEAIGSPPAKRDGIACQHREDLGRIHAVQLELASLPTKNHQSAEGMSALPAENSCIPCQHSDDLGLIS